MNFSMRLLILEGEINLSNNKLIILVNVKFIYTLKLPNYINKIYLLK